MPSGPNYSIGLQWDGAHWQITIASLDLCATAVHAKTFDEAAHVADLMLATAIASRPQAHKNAQRLRSKSAA